MYLNGWKYYKHIIVPISPPNIEANLTLIHNEKLWKQLSPQIILARWTTEWDRDEKSNWWYVIKDTPFDLTKVKSKRRYEINKGLRNFTVKPIDPTLYKEALYSIQIDAYADYPKKYRPVVNKEIFLNEIDNWKKVGVVIGAFSKDDNCLCGYARIIEVGNDFIEFSVLKTKPAYEKKNINHAIVFEMLHYYAEFLSHGGIISDGSRNISHETNFQEFLIKYFSFRKAYCILNVKYNAKYKLLIKVLFFFRSILKRMDHISVFHKINSILKLEAIIREKEGK